MSGAKYQKAKDRALAEQLLSGEGRKLEPGTYAFIDGNHLGGLGIVLVYRRADRSTAVKEIATTVGGRSATLARHLARLRNPLAEVTALYVALGAVNEGTSLTVVHDYEGTGAWLDGRWKLRDSVMKDAVAGCRGLIAEHGLRVIFRHINGHQSAVGGDEYARYNPKADELATRAVQAGVAQVEA